jgi:CRP-like cAMP-binding protein
VAATTTTRSSLKRKLLGDDPIIPCPRALVAIREQPKIQEFVPLIGNFAYVAIASGFLMTDMLQLRLMLVGGYCGLVVFHVLRHQPLRIPLRWSALFVVVNAGMACSLLADRYMAPLSDEEKKLHRQHFAILTPGQFYQLLSLGTREDVPDRTVFTVEGEPCPKLYFIETGQARVYHHRDFVSTIGAGGFVNDVAFQRGENVGAYGTIVATGPCSVLVWDQSTLRGHLRKRPAMDRNLKYILSDHLVKSLLRQREVAHLRQRQSWTGPTDAASANEVAPAPVAVSEAPNNGPTAPAGGAIHRAPS